MKCNSPGWGNSCLKKVNIIKDNIINTPKNNELEILKYCEENAAGIIIKNINGFVIPPVKK